MEEKARELSERLLDYGVEIVKLTMKIGKTATGKQIANQLIRFLTENSRTFSEPSNIVVVIEEI